MIRPVWAAAVAFATVSAGCASTSPHPAFEELAKTVNARSGHTLRWSQGSEDREVERAIDQLLERELSADAAVEVALLNSPRLKAELEELAIARADLVQAGLLKNPVFALGSTAFEGDQISPNLVLSVEEDFLAIVTMPMRKHLAALQFEATKLEVGDQVLELAARVREAYYAAQSAEQVLTMRALVEEAAKASGELAERQHDAGNMNDLALNTQLALQAQTTLDRRRGEGEVTVAREKLNRLMGTWGPRTGWKLAAKLPELPAEEPSPDRLESRAIEQRLDVSAARGNVRALQYALMLAKTTRWTGIISVSVEGARLREGRVSLGPSVALEIPLFDQRQAQVAKLEAFVRQADDNLTALAVDVRTEVRAARARVLTARAVVEDYGKVVVPLRENVVRLSQEQYDAMLLGAYQLIQAKQSEYEAYRAYIDALRDYWVARSDLERAVGERIGALPASAPRPPAQPSAPPPSDHSKMHM